MIFFHFGRTMITLSLIVRFVTIPKKCGNGYQKKGGEGGNLQSRWHLPVYLSNDMLIPDTDAVEHENYFAVVDGEESGEEFNWTEIPLIPFKYNKQELPLINRVKTIQDGINTMLSDFENNMQEDARNTILILKNYDGQDLGEFRHNLSTFGAVKVRNDGGVETLQIEINAENYKSVLELMKKALIENARAMMPRMIDFPGTLTR